MKKLSWVYFVVIFTFCGCATELNNGNSGQLKPTEEKVYITGYSNGSPCYLINGTVHTLSGEADCSYELSDLKVYNGQTYIVGWSYYVNSDGWPPYRHSDQACYWVDGNQIVLTPGVQSRATNILFFENEVFISGLVRQNNIWKACYWKNGILNVLGTAMDRASVGICLFIDQNDIYVGGAYITEEEFFGETATGSNTNGKLRACHWKNGDKIDLNIYGEIQYIAKIDDDIIFTGEHHRYFDDGRLKIDAFYWENTELTVYDVLGQVRYGQIVKFVNGKTYFVGYKTIVEKVGNGSRSYSIPCYFVNGITNTLPIGADENTSGMAIGVSVYDSDVYVAGSVWMDVADEKYCYWKNGVIVYLPDDFRFSSNNMIYIFQ